MTDDLSRRLREATDAKKLHAMSVGALVALLREAADALDAERLKRQQAEHERDSILEDLKGACVALDAARLNERRYLWLRKRRKECDVMFEAYNEDGPVGVTYSLNGAELDAEIDAALAQGDTREGTT